MAEEHFAALRPRRSNIITPENSPSPSSVNTTNVACSITISERERGSFRIDLYKAHQSEKWGMLWSSALWLAEYLKRENTEMLRPLPYCDAVSRRDDTKTIKPIINEAFFASSGDYNDLYCLFTRCIAPRKHYHVCICGRRNDKQQALLDTAELAFE